MASISFHHNVVFLIVKVYTTKKLYKTADISLLLLFKKQYLKTGVFSKTYRTSHLGAQHL